MESGFQLAFSGHISILLLSSLSLCLSSGFLGSWSLTAFLCNNRSMNSRLIIVPLSSCASAAAIPWQRYSNTAL
ncbi:hypothetical protein B9Z19DRAFT_1072920 [Tuber borchii]|uniref:Uncharacterized protein n=1 Tax=Tuber borchii TaxID=42251 RepID=A0A2T7A6K5_TUBBO|nr:hypothetical protein B9Z19DRAFT_1072920 [Tuber borchii]